MPVARTIQKSSISSLYNYSKGFRGGAKHGSKYATGIDIAAPTGESVLAVAGGEVIVAGWDYQSGFGNHIIISHNNGEYYSLYAHLSKILVSVNTHVTSEQPIGEVGNTSGKYTLGPHLHFELATANTSGAPGDPWRQFYREKYKSLISYDIECYGDVSANPEDVKEWIRNNGILLK